MVGDLQTPLEQDVLEGYLPVELTSWDPLDVLAVREFWSVIDVHLLCAQN